MKAKEVDCGMLPNKIRVSMSLGEADELQKEISKLSMKVDLSQFPLLRKLHNKLGKLPA